MLLALCLWEIEVAGRIRAAKEKIDADLINMYVGAAHTWLCPVSLLLDVSRPRFANSAPATRLLCGQWLSHGIGRTSGMYRTVPWPALYCGESASAGTGIRISTPLAADCGLNCALALTT